MNDTNELNDIILNKGATSGSNKKIILAIATLGIILIIVVMLMNSLTSDGTQNLPQAVLPPQPQALNNKADAQEEPLFQDIDVIQEKNSEDSLAVIAQKLKEESLQEDKILSKKLQEKKELAKKEALVKSVQVTPPATPKVINSHAITYYVQVGSFSKYEPNKKFLKSITALGYKYKYHTVIVKSKSINKVLVGPFNSHKDAKNARRILRSKVEPGAFLFKLKK